MYSATQSHGLLFTYTISQNNTPRQKTLHIMLSLFLSLSLLRLSAAVISLTLSECWSRKHAPIHMLFFHPDR